ncbi:Arylsulfatase [Pontiella sulfatireligans]|uniref:Arylsulfatase n=2 Tax=Pontiella sulfatireligans TaxID=2750658 RepID=A0A6C2UPS0_9BACT|nr:sulfatase S1_28 [Kiritimatiellales bacterium]VGO22292.1 Arylsulfatase [Pontiella sulfatireligans]
MKMQTKQTMILLLGVAACTAPMADAAAKKPNILFILADDQCWETIGCIGGEVKTPNLDKLVAGGVSFKRAYNMGSWSGAVCVASRHMFNTGRYVWNCNDLIKQSAKWKKTHKNKPFPGQIKSWSQQLGDAGYSTYFAGKWHVSMFSAKQVFDVVGTERGGMPKQTPEGYNRPLDENDKNWLPWDKSKGGFWEGGTHWSEVLRDEAIGFIDQASQDDKPFFMYIAFNAAHDPRQAPKEFVDMYPIESIKLPENFQPLYPYADDIGCGKSLRDARLAPFPRTEYSVKVNRQEYYALVTHMDVQIGKILEALEKSGELDNTYIFYTADHGLAIGHHGLIGKQNMYEHSLGAPLIVNGPGLESGKRITERVYIQDIMPTTLELAGADMPDEVDFQSLLPLITGKTQKGRDVIYGAYKNLQRCVMQGDWKLMHYPKASKYRLFNVAKDPNEMNDLAENPEYAERLKTMKEALASEMVRQNDHELD